MEIQSVFIVVPPQGVIQSPLIVKSIKYTITKPSSSLNSAASFERWLLIKKNVSLVGQPMGYNNLTRPMVYNLPLAAAVRAVCIIDYISIIYGVGGGTHRGRYLYNFTPGSGYLTPWYYLKGRKTLLLAIIQGGGGACVWFTHTPEYTVERERENGPHTR